MRGKVLAVLTLASLGASAIAAGARADWQYTRWGMTPQGVVAASQGAVQLGPTPSGKTYDKLTGHARGVYRAGGASYDAYFHFDAATRLKKVALEHTGGTACAMLHSQLLAQYGTPVKSARQTYGTIDEWRDAPRGNYVRYVQVGDLPCTITFDQL